MHLTQGAAKVALYTLTVTLINEISLVFASLVPQVTVAFMGRQTVSQIHIPLGMTHLYMYSISHSQESVNFFHN